MENNIARGFLKLYDKNSGRELSKCNLVVKNAMHVVILGLKGIIDSKTIKVASWGDIYEEYPSDSNYTMNNIDALDADDKTKQNNTVSTLNVTNYCHPATKSIRFTFEMNSTTIPDLIDKNVQEFGLYFNNILFSRVILDTDFIFDTNMNIMGDWTIILTDYYGEFSNLLLNQYTLESVWNVNEVEEDLIKDKKSINNLSSTLDSPVLTSDIIEYVEDNTNDLGLSSIDSSDLINGDSIYIPYVEESTKNLLKIHDGDQMGLELKNQFTIWQWFKIKDMNNIDSYVDSYESLPIDNEWVMCSKWIKDLNNENCSYRIYLEREGSEYNDSSSSSDSSSDSEEATGGVTGIVGVSSGHTVETTGGTSAIQYSTTGSGVGFEMDVTLSSTWNNYKAYSSSITSQGSGYSVGDEITLEIPDNSYSIIPGIVIRVTSIAQLIGV